MTAAGGEEGKTSSSSSSSSSTRPRIIYPDSGPTAPYPLRMEGRVIAGFGRGSKELGIPTANLPVSTTATPWIETAASGVYLGYASLRLPREHPDARAPSPSSPSPSPPCPAAAADDDEDDDDGSAAWQIYPMVMSIGYNPFYKNTVRSAEVHVLHEFGADFYGARMRLLLLGYVRDERDYSGLEALVEDIHVDCDVARQSLARPAWTPAQGTVAGKKGSLDARWLVGEG